MATPISRRALLAGAGAMLAIPQRAGSTPAATDLTGRIKLSMPVDAGLSDDALAFVAHLGVQYVVTGGPAFPTYTDEGRVVQARADDPAPPWKEEDLRRMKARVEGAGLKLGNLMLHDFRNAVLGRPGADDDIEKVQESIRVAGRVGIPIVEYNWYALRAMGGYYEEAGPRRHASGRARLRSQPRSARARRMSAPQRRRAVDALRAFSQGRGPGRRAAPNVRLAVHPNDPPPPRYRGIEQILGSVDGLRRVCDIVKSPANGITFDTGVTREMGYNVIENIKWFGGRDQINHVHFRNVLMRCRARNTSRRLSTQATTTCWRACARCRAPAILACSTRTTFRICRATQRPARRLGLRGGPDQSDDAAALR